MTLIDTPSLVEAVRPRGDLVVRQRVNDLFHEGLACWCEPIRLELWNHRGDQRERKILEDFESKLPSYPLTDDVWELARQIAIRARDGGVTVPAVDLAIFACAKIHGLDIESADEHFVMLAKL